MIALTSRLRAALFALVLLATLAVPSLARAQDPARAQDIVLGFFNRTLPDGTHNLVEELERAKGGLEYFEWDAMGFPAASYGTWDQRRVWSAMEFMVQTGHRIHFNLTGFKFEGSRNPLNLARDVDAGTVGYTNWELTQIRTHRAFWEATDFFLRQGDGSYRQATTKELADLGLRYTAPELPALGELKGKLLSRTPDEDVYAVRHEPGRELVVRHAPAGESDVDAARRAEDLVEEKAALEALATHGVKVARRYEVGTFKGELAFVRDRLSRGSSTTVVTDGKSITMTPDASGDYVVSEIDSPQVRVDADVSSELATAVQTKLSDALKSAARAPTTTTAASDVDPALLAKIKARDGTVDAQAPRTGVAEVVEDRTRGARAEDR